MVAEFKDAKQPAIPPERSASRPAKTALPRAPQPTERTVRDIELAGRRLHTEDYRSLLELSGAETAFFSFEQSISIEQPPERIINAMWRNGPLCLEANRRFAEAHGYEKVEQLLGLPFALLFPRNETNLRVISNWVHSNFNLLRSEMREGESGKVTEYSIYTKIQDGSVRSMWIIVRDLTRRKETLLALREAEEHYRTLVERPGLILVRAKPSGDIVYISPHVKDTVDFKPEDFRSDPDLMSKLLHPDDRTRYGKLIEQRRARSKKTGEIEYRVRHKDGSYHWFYERQTPKIDARGEVEFYDSIVLDIQERKQLEVQLMHAQRMETMGTFAQGLAHDFNNRLAAMLGQIGLSLKQLDPEHPCYAPLAAAEQAAVRCGEMTRSLLQFGSMADAAHEPLSLLKLLDDIVQLLLHILPSTIETTLRAAGGLQLVRGSYVQLQQVLINLAVNARDAMPKGGTLTISARNVTLPQERSAERYAGAAPGGYVEISVTDSGEGIPSSCLPYIFDPFFSTKPNQKATGLGLSTVYSIVKAHKGAIQVANVRGGGTSFSMIFPVCSEAEKECSPEETPVVIKGSETVLVADDDEMVREMVKSALTLHGYRVITACDGQEAVDVFIRHQGEIGLALIDQTMPKLTGREVLNKICSLAPMLPILLTSGYSECRLDTTINDRMVRFISKPYRLTSLLSLVRELLDTSKAALIH